MPKLHLVLAESALELVPEALWSHPAVAKSARSRSKSPRDILLDDTYHHSAMRAAANQGSFPDLERRGRPDIVHLSLLVALESRLNLEDGLAVWVHTRDDALIEVDPSVRIQRAQHRFVGLMERLFQDAVVPTPEKGPPLMRLHRGVTLTEAVRRTGARHVIVLDETGDEDDVLEQVFHETAPHEAEDAQGTKRAPDAGVAAVVGGFAHGGITSDLTDLGHRTVRLGDRPLSAWSVVAELVVRYGHARRTGHVGKGISGGVAQG